MCRLCQTRRAEWKSIYQPYWPLGPLAKSLPPRVRGFFEHVNQNPIALSTLLMSFFYSLRLRTLPAPSMHIRVCTQDRWQRQWQGDHKRYELQSHTTKIIELAQQVVAEQRWEKHYIPFALFLAGVVSKRGDEMTLVLGLLIAMEKESTAKTLSR